MKLRHLLLAVAFAAIGAQAVEARDVYFYHGRNFDNYGGYHPVPRYYQPAPHYYRPYAPRYRAYEGYRGNTNSYPRYGYGHRQRYGGQRVPFNECRGDPRLGQCW